MKTIIIIMLIIIALSSCKTPFVVGNSLITPGNGYKIYDTARHNQLLLTLKAGDTCSKCKTVHKK